MIEHTCYDHRWFVAHNGADLYQLFDAEAGQTVRTGQPHLDEYATEDAALAAIPEQYRPGRSAL